MSIMKNIILIFAICSTFLSCDTTGKKEVTKETDSLLITIDSSLQIATRQYEFLSKQVTPGNYPRTYNKEKNKLETSGSGWWCSGFYPGTMLYLDEVNETDKFQNQITAFLGNLQKEQYNTTTHDLGFMMFCSFGNAERILKNQKYEEILMNSARSLSTRYNDTAKVIRSWDSAPWNHAGNDQIAVIIDNMMNLELLLWASDFSKDSTFYNIAVNHANTTMANHFRPDFSSFHEVIYDENTGEAIAHITNQGAADSSSWSRGQAWGLYGYTMMYRETGNKKYLQQAQHIADYILNNSKLPKDNIPYWDFDAPNIPNTNRDSSAAAIMASALIELCTYSEEDKSKRYLQNAALMLSTLLSPEYFAKVGENGGFLLKHGVGNMPNNSEIDTPLSYGDYYLVEAMIRYKNLKNHIK